MAWNDPTIKHDKMEHKVIDEIREQLDIWKTAVIKHPYSDVQSTIQMEQLIAMIVGYISGIEDKIDKLCKLEMKS